MSKNIFNRKTSTSDTDVIAGTNMQVSKSDQNFTVNCTLPFSYNPGTWELEGDVNLLKLPLDNATPRMYGVAYQTIVRDDNYIGLGPSIESGSYTPTITGVGTSAWYTNILLRGAYYMRTGDIVKGNITFWSSPSATSTDVFEFNITLPVSPSVAFGSDGEDRLVGQANLVQTVGSGRVAMACYGATGNIMKVKAGTNLATVSGTDYRISCDFSYSIV